jgi:hypothetical protein
VNSRIDVNVKTSGDNSRTSDSSARTSDSMVVNVLRDKS